MASKHSISRRSFLKAVGAGSAAVGAAGADIVIVGVICRVSVGIAGGDIQYALLLPPSWPQSRC